MGYYDSSEEPKQRRRKSLPWKSVSTSIISGIVGGALVLGVYPLTEGKGSGAGLQPAQTEQQQPAETASSFTKQAEPVSNPASGNSVADIVDRLSPAIVGVSNQQQGFDNSGQQSSRENGSGSGVIFKKSGNDAFIVTNNHVVEGAESIQITLSDGKKEEADLVGTDPLSDLAVLKISSKNVKAAAPFGDSSKLRAGEKVIAIGNPLGLEFSRTVTEGIISGKDRSVSVTTSAGDWQLNVLQTDAAINPGNSGGPLINMNGEVIGINSLKISQSGVEGLGFAIPSKDVMPIAEQLLKDGKVQRPMLGVSLVDASQIPQAFMKDSLQLPSDVTEGALVEQVQYNSPADAAGLQKQDFITAIDGKAIQDSTGLRKELYSKKVGDKITITAYRNGKVITKTVTLTKNS
ncbi:trypsin-like peptidase domain-containing protein [Metabacillus sp. GX 13764]|uniref:S1C family serine protease n=1 Tax=Metabacillus kandeliae TaxID=2900151 RepID=UPI001E46EF0F|nr:trypsin-like peptidase domain-containing protein [Metabacillus kandeliae]MCD7035546.1 trypsin-like peptidase domain-containing protein [Metabacillus kandeliae]